MQTPATARGRSVLAFVVPTAGDIGSTVLDHLANERTGDSGRSPSESARTVEVATRVVVESPEAREAVGDVQLCRRMDPGHL